MPRSIDDRLLRLGAVGDLRQLADLVEAWGDEPVPEQEETRPCPVCNPAGDSFQIPSTCLRCNGLGRLVREHHEPPELLSIHEIRRNRTNEYAWGIQVWSLGWHRICYADQTEAESVRDALLLQWLESNQPLPESEQLLDIVHEFQMTTLG